MIGGRIRIGDEHRGHATDGQFRKRGASSAADRQIATGQRARHVGDEGMDGRLDLEPAVKRGRSLEIVFAGLVHDPP